MMKNKMTKAVKFEAIATFLQEGSFELEGFDAVEFLKSEAEKSSKKRTAGASKPTKAQLENLETIKSIVAFLNANPGKLFSAKEIADEMKLDFSSQKMTALMKKAVSDELVVKGKSTDNPKLIGYGTK